MGTMGTVREDGDSRDNREDGASLWFWHSASLRAGAQGDVRRSLLGKANAAQPCVNSKIAADLKATREQMHRCFV